MGTMRNPIADGRLALSKVATRETIALSNSMEKAVV